jgi:hypothetical protein
VLMRCLCWPSEDFFQLVSADGVDQSSYHPIAYNNAVGRVRRFGRNNGVPSTLDQGGMGSLCLSSLIRSWHFWYVHDGATLGNGCCHFRDPINDRKLHLCRLNYVYPESAGSPSPNVAWTYCFSSWRRSTRPAMVFRGILRITRER